MFFYACFTFCFIYNLNIFIVCIKFSWLDDFNDFSSSKKKVRRSSLSKYDHTAAHNNSTFTDYSHLTAPADSTASIKGGGSKRGK